MHYEEAIKYLRLVSDAFAESRNTYPDTKVVKLEKKRNGHEVKLSNGWELEFNRNFELIDMDN